MEQSIVAIRTSRTRTHHGDSTTARLLFTIKLPVREIDTGYGVGLREGELGLPHFAELARKTGFNAISKNSAQAWFFLELAKPAAK